VDLASEDLFGESFGDGAFTVFAASVVSAEATGLRLVVDLSGLEDTAEVWVLDPVSPRAFGPYTGADHLEGGRWLPTIEGDTAVLLVRSVSGNLPHLRLVAVSHFFQGFQDALKELFCNISIACESDPVIQDISTGIGLMVVPQPGYDSALCTGSLINNADTPGFEPYFLTSWHCVPSAYEAAQVDVLWDYRASACEANDPPPLSSLLRSSGDAVLTTSSLYDITLMRLLWVPEGALGRAYLGWTTATPGVGGGVVGIHHPRGTHMRISYGTVTDLNEFSQGFQKQTKVHWYNGVTENGSSGNPLLLESADYRVAGTLSNGPVHSCSSTEGNVDWYSSFRDFYPQAQGWLSGADPPPDPDPTGKGLCAAGKTFRDHPEILDQLRFLRDKGLLKSGFGRQIVEAYYRSAPQMADRVDESAEARDAFAAVAAPFASLGELME
jgi:hypothetical protein